MTEKPKRRILILNNYSVKRVTNEIKSGFKPLHHLYGILELEDQGYELIIIDPGDSRFWGKVSRIVDKIPFSRMGDLQQQFWAFKRRNEYDIIYAPCQTVTQFLGLLCYFRLFNKKIIAIGHHPMLVGKLSFLRKVGYYLTLKGHYKWGTLSSKVANEINMITRSNIAELFHWGPDLKFYDKVSISQNLTIAEKSVDIISIGRTGRDYQVLIDAFNNTDVILEIYCSKESAQRLSTSYTSNIKVIGLDNEESLSYLELIRLYKTAKIMAIPLFAQNGLAGLTSLTDATALGMPVIMTKNNFIEIDIEKEKIGYWIDPGNSLQWKAKTLSLLSSTELDKYGTNSREIADKQFNSSFFFQELLGVIGGI